MSFSELGLLPELLQAIARADLAVPTPIQAAAIPAILDSRDVRARAQTGSGKTAAFALPLLQRLAKHPPGADRQISGLVLVPTRELAMQVGESFLTFSRHLPQHVKVLTVFGGVSINPQMMALRGGADIVIATPGRLLDLAEHNALRLSALSTLVLDEADRLLDEGFADELARVIALLPDRRQNLLFSATFPPAVQALAERLLHDQVCIDIADTVETAPDIQQRAITVDAERRTQLLHHLIQHHGWERVLVFVATKHATEHVALKLQRLQIAARALHGEMSQGARTGALAEFKAGRVQVLVATDLAARGIDILELPAVVNFDLPRSTDDYLHRIGRTGRAGASGVAINFVSAGTEAHFRLIEKRHGWRLEREQLPGFQPTAPAPTRSVTGGVKGKRRSKKDRLREAAVARTPAATTGNRIE